MDIQFIGADPGRRHTKVVSGEEKKCFRSAVGEWRRRNLETERDYEVEINGTRHFVGDLAIESHFGREMTTESKIHQETKILFLTAIALVAKQDRFVITTGLPVNQHRPRIKTDLTSLLAGRHKVRINQGPLQDLFIEEPGIVAEGVGLYWDEVLDHEGEIKNPWLASQKTVRILEVGSRTINLGTIVFQDGKRMYLDRESATLDYGYLALENAEADPSPEAMEGFSRKIAADASRKWLTYQQTKDVVLLGGGGILSLGQYLRRHYPINITSSDPLFGNASGFGKMGLVRWQKKNVS